MNIDNLTYGELKKVAELFGNKKQSLNCQIGEKVIIRTYSAGVWFGELSQKAGDEVILKNARRMYAWKAAKSISLSGVAEHGIDQKESEICPAISKVWLQPIEILTLTKKSIESIEGASDAEAR